MELTAPAIGPLLGREPIPGYVLRQRLGAGGYGEVWEAEAPGGLRKAIKFIYGTLDESRAQCELKSLNRIREVHHPFLLSLERIEVIDGRLIIVTELAHGCVKTRFDECKQSGMAGIPRAELLNYLRDAADALDFIHDQHGLQHLDVKPENLLLVGNHVKVADFGLLKDLDETASVMGGLTPLYCPPEALEGHPSRHSDQYSLAIVYQEMLTGECPFGGRTAAQLAAQHLHSPPSLGPLAPADQLVIGRALAKNPAQRFPNCVTMIEHLLEGMGGAAPTVPRRSRPNAFRQPPRAMSKTDPLAGASSDAQPKPNTTSICEPAKVRDLPRLEVDTADVAYSPVILIGVGGTGGRILSQVQRRIAEAWGNPAAIPAVQLLLLDTDPRDLTAATYKRGDGCLPAQNTVSMPLRSANDYRTNSKNILEWLKRRWLFNIPRSLQTEGMRPLGRLAFVDHIGALMQRLRSTIETAVSKDAVGESQETTALPFQQGAPKIFLIGSISGGTGSGVVLDLAYAVRKLLGELKLPADSLCGLLTHSTSRKSASRDLAVANTLACLDELRHFSTPRQGYPGDPACELPACQDNQPTFPHIYVVHLGNDLGDGEYESSVDRLAEYVFQSTLTPASVFFDRARVESSAERTPGRLRTLGLAFFQPALATAEEAPADDEEEEADEEMEDEDLADDGDEEGEDEDDTHETDADLDETHCISRSLPSLEDCCRDSLPVLATCGGSRRTLIIAPQCISPEDLSQASPEVLSESATRIDHPRGDVVVCQELEDVPIERVISHLVGGRRDYVELAERLHTRIDVDWTPLLG